MLLPEYTSLSRTFSNTTTSTTPPRSTIRVSRNQRHSSCYYNYYSAKKSCISISKLQMKGILTLGLLFLSNAAIPPGVVNNVHHNYKTQDDDEHDSSSSSSSFEHDSLSQRQEQLDYPQQQQSKDDESSSTSSAILSADGHVILSDENQNNGDSTAACTQCWEQCGWNTIPRGGHGGGPKVTTGETVAELMTQAASAAAGKTATPYGIPLHVWKVLFQAFLTAINVFCWLGPLQSEQISNNQLALSLANAFSGGVFLSLAFFHLIPECVHGFDATWPETAPYSMVLAGYLLIFFVEKVAFDAHDILHEMQHKHEESQQQSKTTAAATTKTTASDHSKQLNGRVNPATSPTTPSAKESSSSSVSSGGTAAVVDTSSASSSGRSALILLGALGVHSVLEMMALGLCDSFGDAALLTTSIALHQPAESIALLVAFLKSGMSKAQIIQSLSIFSCMGPVGVALGMAVNEYAAPVVDSIMLAVVAGTFVYVGATEVIPEEWEDSNHKWKKFAALMSGIFMIIAVTQYTATWGEI